MEGVPRPLLLKRADVAYELARADSKAEPLRAQLRTLEDASRILIPGWKPPAGAARRRPVKVNEGAGDAVVSGDGARERIRVLKEVRRPLTTTEIADAIASAHALPFSGQCRPQAIDIQHPARVVDFKRRGWLPSRRTTNGPSLGVRRTLGVRRGSPERQGHLTLRALSQ